MIVALRFDNENAARAALTAIGSAVGVPRCNHPRWKATGKGLRRRKNYASLVSAGGLTRVCPCTDPSDPDPYCFCATWQVGGVFADGSDYIVEVESDLLASVRPGLLLPDSEARLPPDPDRESAVDVRAERRAARNGVPDAR